MKASLPLNEAERLKSPRDYKMLATLPRQEFDDVTFLASLICGTPVALISLVDENRQWFKSKVGNLGKIVALFAQSAGVGQGSTFTLELPPQRDKEQL